MAHASALSPTRIVPAKKKKAPEGAPARTLPRAKPLRPPRTGCAVGPSAIRIQVLLSLPNGL